MYVSFHAYYVNLAANSLNEGKKSYFIPKSIVCCLILIMSCPTMPSTMPKMQAIFSVIDTNKSYSLIISKFFTLKMLILIF